MNHTVDSTPRPATCDKPESHAAQLGFYGECAWCGEVTA